MHTNTGESPRVLYLIGIVAAVSTLAFLITSSLPFSPTRPLYLSPQAGARFVSKGAAITVRYGPSLDEKTASTLTFDVRGDQSGVHAGQTVLADDHKTVIFKPDQPFIPGEKVQVEIGRLQLGPTTAYEPLSYSFTVGLNQKSWSPGATSDEELPNMAVAFPAYLTLPEDIPKFTVTSGPGETADGYIFVAPLQWLKTEIGSYLLILDNQGELVYYQSATDDIAAYDFKKQPNGLLSYFSQADATYYLMDSHYQVVDRYQAGNGYRADLHDFQVLPNGDVMFMAYDSQAVDMSKFVLGGQKDAQVIGLIIQEMDPSKNVIFEWRSWDHIDFRDSSVDLTPEEGGIDYVHGNSLDLDSDGNILLSSRNLQEITKIDRETGKIIWRLGGKRNTFRFIGDRPFGHQHDARVIADGDITVFDNLGQPGPSRGVEYEVNENLRTARKVWEFAHDPPVFATFMGNTQRLPNGNTLLSWGAPSQEDGFYFANITEVNAENEPVFELSFDPPFVSYRAFRFPWQGFPNSRPDLAFDVEDGTITLGYSWNGATEVAAYKVFGGSSPQAGELIEQKPRAGFETQSRLNDLPAQECYFKVIPVDRHGVELTPSAVISTDPELCPLEP